MPFTNFIWILSKITYSYSYVSIFQFILIHDNFSNTMLDQMHKLTIKINRLNVRFRWKADVQK